MPAIHLFGRRTLLGGDDLQPSCVVSILWRCFQCVVLLGLLWKHWVAEIVFNSELISRFLVKSSECGQRHAFMSLLFCYLVASTAHGLVTVYLECRIMHFSSLGNPTIDREPRTKYVVQLLQYKLWHCSIALFVIWFLGVTCLAYVSDYARCTTPMLEVQQRRSLPPLWWIAFLSLLVTQIGEVVAVWIFLLHLFRQPAVRLIVVNDPQHRTDQGASQDIMTVTVEAESIRALTAATSPNRVLPDFMADTESSNEGTYQHPMELLASRISDHGQQQHHHHHELIEDMWSQRCTWACRCLSVSTCYMFGGQDIQPGQVEFGAVARALADYLETRGVLDVVPSDIATGLVLLQRLQRQRVYLARQSVLRDHLQQQRSRNSLRATANSLARTDSPHSVSLPVSTANDLLSSSAGISPSNFNQPEPAPMDMEAQTSVAPLRIERELRLRRSGGDNASTNDLGASQPIIASSKNSQTSVEDAMSRPQLSTYHLTAQGGLERRHRRLLDPLNRDDQIALEDGARYANFALAIYTWVLYLYDRPISGVPRLLTRAKCRCQRPVPSPSMHSPRPTDGLMGENGRIIGDNLCGIHKSALLLTAGIDEADVVYAQLRSSFNEVPYCILLDHRRESIVVSIRGTFSLEDCVTDVLIDPEPLDDLGRAYGFDSSNQFCHSGVLASARCVLRDLERHQIIDRLLSERDSLYSDYRLLLTGHSLGAAACAVLSFVLRPRYPNLRVFLYR
jgi:Lipase (class 3)